MSNKTDELIAVSAVSVFVVVFMAFALYLHHQKAIDSLLFGNTGGLGAQERQG